MNIVILSRNANLYSTIALQQAAIKRRHNVRIIDPINCDIVIEQKNPVIYYKGRRLDHVDAVIPRIGSSITYYGTSIIRQFEMMGVFTTLGSQSLVLSRDKLQSLQVLSKAKLGLPKTVFTNYSKNIDDIIQHVGGAPLIIKLLEGTQGLGVVLAETKNAAKSVIEAFNGLQARIIVQEFIEEAKGVDIRVFVVGGRVVGAMKRKGEEGEFRSNLHRGGTAEVVLLSEEEKEAAIEAVKVLNLAVAGVDMLQSNRGPLILEVNSSPGLEGIEKATGRDVARDIIRYIEKNA